jgi:hypothetical protein
LGKTLHQIHAALLLQVQAEPTFANVLLQVIARLAVLEIGVVSAGVAALWPFDLNHVGAHRRQRPAEVRPGEEMGEIDDPDAVKRERLGHFTASPASGLRRIISLWRPLWTTSPLWLNNSLSR